MIALAGRKIAFDGWLLNFQSQSTRDWEAFGVLGVLGWTSHVLNVYFGITGIHDSKGEGW